VNQTVDGMSEERSKLQADIQQVKLDLETQIRSKRQLEQENATLLDRISSFEQQKVRKKIMLYYYKQISLL